MGLENTYIHLNKEKYTSFIDVYLLFQNLQWWKCKMPILAAWCSLATVLTLGD